MSLSWDIHLPWGVNIAWVALLFSAEMSYIVTCGELDHRDCMAGEQHGDERNKGVDAGNRMQSK